MCWGFAETWLEEPEQHADYRRPHRTWEYIPSRHRRRRAKRYVCVEPGTQQVVEAVQQQPMEKYCEYVPAEPEKVVSSKKRDVLVVKTQPQEPVVVKTKTKERVAGDVTNNEWEYVPAAPTKKGSSRRSSKKIITVVSSVPSCFISF